MPSLSRQDVLDVVGQCWQGIDHANVRTKGYIQTGPSLPDDSGLDALFKDLRPYWEAIDGEALRAEAYATVDRMWDAQELRSWADVQLVIEDHVPHPVMEEGLEAADWEIQEHSDDDNDDDDDDDPGDQDGGPGALVEAEGASLAGNGAEGSSPAGSGSGGDPAASCPAGGSAEDAPAAWGGLCDDPKYLEALSTVMQVAKQTRNDKLFRVVRDARRQSARKADAYVGSAALALRQTAKDDRDRIVHEREQRRELERQAALEDLDAKRTLEVARKETAQARREALEASTAIRAAALARQQDRDKEKQATSWLQVNFPVLLSKRCAKVKTVRGRRQGASTTRNTFTPLQRIAPLVTPPETNPNPLCCPRLLQWRGGLHAEALEDFKKDVTHVTRTGRHLRMAEFPRLWADDRRLSEDFAFVRLPGGRRVPVHAPKDFEWQLCGEKWASEIRDADAALLLQKLLSRIVPSSNLLFSRRYTTIGLLQTAEFSVPKAFVMAVILLSKWLGEERFPAGVHRWPPRECPHA